MLLIFLFSKNIQAKSYDPNAGIYSLLLEKRRKASVSSTCTSTSVRSEAASLDDGTELMDTDAEVERATAHARSSGRRESIVPVVHVTPDSPTRELTTNTWQQSTSEENEEDDQVAEEMPPNLKAYLATRRYTVTAVDPMHEISEELRELLNQKLDGGPPSPIPPLPGMPPFSPTTDLSLAYKEQILQVPSVFQLRQPFGRRASDGAASLGAGIAQFNALRALTQMGETNLSNPGSQVDNTQCSSTPAPFTVSPGPSSPHMSEANDSGSDQEPDPEAVARYLNKRGARQRHTLGVTEPSSEIPDDLQMKLLQLPLKARRGFSPVRERTPRENNLVPTHGGMRYTSSRRASDGAASILAFKQHLERNQGSGSKRNSLKELQEEHQKLREQYGSLLEEETQRVQQQQQQLHNLHHHYQMMGRRASDGSEALASTVAQFQQQLQEQAKKDLELNSQEDDLEDKEILLEPQLQQQMQRLNIETCGGSVGSTSGTSGHYESSVSPRTSVILDGADHRQVYPTQNVLSTSPTPSSLVFDPSSSTSSDPSPPMSPIPTVPMPQRYPATEVQSRTSSSDERILPESALVPGFPVSFQQLSPNLGTHLINENDLVDLTSTPLACGQR